MALTRIGVIGTGKTYGVITDKAESVVVIPSVLFTRIGVGGVGITLGAVADKNESSVITRPGTLLTKIGVGGVGITLGTITDKSEGGQIGRPGTLFTRIAVGGVGSTYTVTAKGEAIIVDEHIPGYYGTGRFIGKHKQDDEIIALIMAMYETNIF